jgi:TonB-linked SusC/RagA family outer membrane protein
MNFNLHTPIDWCKIMKNTLGQLLFAIILTGVSYAESSKAQAILDRTVNLTVNDLSLNSALQKLGKQASVKFVYSKNVINTNKKVSIRADGAKLNQVLDQILICNKITYAVINDCIVLNNSGNNGSAEDEMLENENFGIDNGQQVNISGRVTDEKGEPLPGVSVLVKGTNIGATTDADGKYVINVPNTTATFVFTYVGFTTQEVPINGRNSINVTLKEESKSLEEVVVVGYGVQKKETVTGSVATVKGVDLQKSPTVNLSNAIAGRMPGVIAMQSSGEPGFDGSALRIRGSNTLGNNDALVVIDGVPARAGGFERLNPADIENISVLKDAAAAIYGARAANGVILVTTRRGKTGSPQLSYSFNQGYSQPTRVPEMSDALQFAELRNELDLYGLPVDQWGSAWTSFKQTGSYTRPDGSVTTATFKPEDFEKFRNGSDPWGHPNTDWYGAAFKNWSPQSRHNLQLSGGTEAIKYLASLGYNNQDAYYKNAATGYKQYEIRANLDGKINKYINASLGFNGRQENRFFPTRSAGAIFRMLMRSSPTQPAYWPNGKPGPDIENGENPVVISTNQTGYDRDTRYYFQSNGKVDIDIPWVKGLKVTGTAAVDRFVKQTKNWQTPWFLYTWDGVSYEADGTTPKLTEGKRGPDQPLLAQGSENQLNVLLGGLLTYERTFGKHAVTLLAGTNRETIDFNNFGASRRYFISSAIDQMFAGSDREKDNYGSAWERARLNYFGRVAYNFKEKYMAEFLWRYDGSYMFPENSRYGFFPGILAAWRISEEGFFKNNVKFINYLKLRGSWGQLGNDNIVRPNTTDQLMEYQYLSTYGFGQYIINDQVSRTLYETRVPNPNFTWEVANNSDIGLEGELFGGKINFEFDYFYNKRSNILYPKFGSIPRSTGMTLPPENIAKVNNKGYEFRVGYNGQKGDLRFNVSVNGGYAKNKIIFWDEAPGAPEWQRSTGASTNTYNFYVYDGVFKDANDIANNKLDYSALVTALRPGDMKYKDVNGDGKINGDDRTRINKGRDPRFQGGLNFGLQYKQFDLSVLFQGASGGLLYIGTESGSIGNYLAYTYDNRWSVENPNGEHQRIADRGNTYYSSDNTYWLRNSDYIRLKNLEIGYNLPETLSKKIGVGSLRVYANGMNLLTWDKMKIWDPESTSGNGQYYPQARIINTGVSVSF